MNDIVTFNRDKLPKDFAFRNKKGEYLGGEAFVFPICIWNREENLYYFLATGFLISRDGLIVTAKHVFEASNVQNVSSYDLLPENHDLFAFAAISEKNFRKIPVKPHKILSDVSDIGFGQLYFLKHNLSEEYFLFNNVLRLSSEIPHVGDRVYTYSYPGSGFSRIAQDNSNHYIFTPMVINGEVQEIHLKGFNTKPPIGPCISTNMETEEGVSGGPVFNANSQVIGVNAAMRRDTSISYFAPIKYIEEIPFECDGEETTLLNLCKEKHWIDLDS